MVLSVYLISLGPSKSIQSLLTHLAHNSFHLHNISDDKCSCILPWYYCSKHLHRSCEYFLRIRLCLSKKVYTVSMVVILMGKNSREMHGWLRKILSTSVLQKTRGRMTQHDQVAESSYRPLPSFCGKKLSRGFKINTKFAGVD